MAARKGVAYSTVAILALLGILMVSIWSYSQLATGSRFGLTLTQREPQDIAVSNLELTKQFLTQDLKFSSQTSALSIAANGGTQAGVAYWYCDSQPTPPETNEVNYAMSVTIKNFTNAYIATIPNSDLEKLGVQVSQYNCAGVYDNGHDLCTQQDSSQCEGFQTSGMDGGTIQITTPSQAQYTGSLAADVSPNRFYWMYYKLYDDTKASGLLRSIATGLRDSCPTQRANAEGRLQFALQKACDHYENLLAEPDGTKYVTCKIEVLCKDFSSPVACVNTPCQRTALDQQLCWTSASQSAPDQSQEQGNTASLQAAAFAGVRLKVTLTDTKFNIPSADGLQPLVWNLWAETQIANQECRPIDSGGSAQ